MANSSFSNGVQFAWDSTSINLAMTCARKYYYSMVLGIEPKMKSVHLLFGGHYAKALERFFGLRAKGATMEDATVEVVHLALLETWDPETDQPVPFVHNAKTRLGLIRTIVWYIEQFGDESDLNLQTYHLANGEPACELSFKLDMGEDIVLCGHLDRVVEDTAGMKYVLDQKTTGTTVGPYYFQQYDLDNQMSGYTLAGRMVLDTPVKGVIIDAAQIAVGFTRFERGTTLRTDAKLTEWWKSASTTIHTTQHYSERAQHSAEGPESAFPMNLTACGNYGGCPFAKICSASPRIRDAVIETDYQPKLWDPLENR